MLSLFKTDNLYNSSESGLTLVIAIVLTFLFVSVTASITTFAFRELRLSGGGARSLQAFYAADTAIECLLDADLNDNLFYSNQPSGSPVTITDCAGSTAQLTYSQNLSDCGSGALWCYRTASPFIFGFNDSQYQATVSYIALNTDGDNSNPEQIILRSAGRYGSDISRTIERGLEYRYDL